jgi:hypothetical protein
MSLRRVPERVVPITAVISAPPWPPGLAESLAALQGPCVLRSRAWPFEATAYYRAEMGAGLERSFLAHAPRPAGDLAAIKQATNELESRWAVAGQRRVNLDPGQVTAGGLFLASCKPAPHRVHLSGGVYAELTLWYRRGWTALPWTFPDFRSGRYDPFLTQCRRLLKSARRSEGPDRALDGPGGMHPPGP